MPNDNKLFDVYFEGLNVKELKTDNPPLITKSTLMPIAFKMNHKTKSITKHFLPNSTTNNKIDITFRFKQVVGKPFKTQLISMDFDVKQSSTEIGRDNAITIDRRNNMRILVKPIDYSLYQTKLLIKDLTSSELTSDRTYSLRFQFL